MKNLIITLALVIASLTSFAQTTQTTKPTTETKVFVHQGFDDKTWSSVTVVTFISKDFCANITDKGAQFFNTTRQITNSDRIKMAQIFLANYKK